MSDFKDIIEVIRVFGDLISEGYKGQKALDYINKTKNRLINEGPTLYDAFVKYPDAEIRNESAYLLARREQCKLELLDLLDSCNDYLNNNCEESRTEFEEILKKSETNCEILEKDEVRMREKTTQALSRDIKYMNFNNE
jgi:hypothetical protein